MKKLNDFVKKSNFFGLIYKAKFYFDTSMTQIGWITGKFPEIMGFLYLSEKVGVVIPNSVFLPLAVFVFVSLVGFGYFWKNSGLFDVEVYTRTFKNPVDSEILLAARLINKKYGGKK